MADIESPDRVGVKVFPDTRNFLSDLRKTLKRVEKVARVSIPVVADGKRLAAEAKAATAAASKGAGQVKVPAALEDGFLAKMQRDIKAATAKVEAEIPLTAEGESLRREARSRVAELQAQMQAMAVEVPMDVEAAAAQKAELRAAVAQLQAMADPVDVPVDVDAAGAAAETRAATAQMQAVASSNPVRVPIEADRGALDHLRSTLAGISMPSMSSLPKIIAITTLVMAVTNLIPAIATLGVGLAQMLPLLLAVPGLAVGAAAGVATLVVGLSGVGAAFGAAGEGGEEFEEALSKIAPNARSFVRQVHSLAGAFKTMQLGVQNALFEDLGTEIRSLGEAYLPVLTKGMGELAGEINGVVSSWSRMARSQRSLSDTSTMFEDIRDAIDQATPGLTAFSDGFRTLARIGTGFLPGLADGFTDMGERFRDWVNMGDESGSIEESISDAGVAAEKVGRIFTGLGGIIGGLFTGAVGDGDPLGAMADSLHRVADVVQGPAFQKGLGDFFKGVSDGLSGLGDALPDVADALSAIAPGLGSLVRGFGQGLGGAISAVAGFIEKHAETFNSFAQWFEDLDPVVQAAIAGVMLFAPAAMSIGSALAPAIKAIGGLILGFGWVGLAIGLVLGAIAALAIGFWYLYENSEVVRGAVAGVQQALSDMWAVVQPIFAQIKNEIMANWPQMQATAQQTWDTIVTVVTTALQFLQLVIQGFTIIVGGLWNLFGATLLSTLSGYMAASMAAFGGYLGMIQGLFVMFSAIMSGDWSLFWSGLRQVLAGHMQAMAGLVGMGWALISGAFQIGMTMAAVAMSVGFSVINGIAQMGMAAIVSAAQIGWQFITSIFRAQMAIAGAIVSAGWAVIQAAFQLGVTAAQAIVSAGLALLVSLAEIALAPLVSVVTRITSGMGAAFSMGLASITGIIISALSGLPATLFSIGSSMISSLASGMISQIGSVSRAAASAAQSIKDHFRGSPVKKGPLRAWNYGNDTTGAGRKMIGDLADGMDAELRAVAAASNRVATAADIPTSRIADSYASRPSSGAEVAEALADWQPMVSLGGRDFYGAMVRTSNDRKGR